MKRRHAALAALIALLALVAGCSAENGGPNSQRPHYVDLPDGRTVLCVFEKQFDAGGLSCDWATAKETKR